MGRIVAISSGDLSSTRELNKYGITLTNKTHPNVLFIGTASNDAEGYIENITKEYNALGCEVKSLCLYSGSYTEAEIDSLLSWADIIYVGGGNTVFMMEIWKKQGLDKKLKKVYEKDSAVLTGISAGAICWFNCGHTDSASFHNDPNWKYGWAEGMLGFFRVAYCPHYDEEDRKSFDVMLLEKDMPGLAMESDTAFVENRGKQYYIRSREDANAFLIEYKDGVMEKREVEFTDF